MVDFRRHTRSARPVRTVPRVDSKGHLCGVIILPADVFRVSLRAGSFPTTLNTATRSRSNAKYALQVSASF